MPFSLNPNQAAEFILTISGQLVEPKEVGKWYRKLITMAKENTLTFEKVGRKYFFDADEIKAIGEQEKRYVDQQNKIEEQKKQYQGQHQEATVCSEAKDQDKIDKRLIRELIMIHEKASIPPEDTLLLIKHLID